MKITSEVKKQGEINCVKKFISNKSETFDHALIDLNHDEPVDLGYRELKFQIVNADFKFSKDIMLKKGHQSNRNKDEVFRDFVIDPIEKKRKFESSADGIILLIDSKTCPPDHFINNCLSVYPTQNFDIGFLSIFLVTPCRNHQIF